MVLVAFCALLFSLAVNSVAADELPMLNMDGFSWAENLVFDGLGGLFVSDAVRGEVWKIELCQNATSYCGSVYLSEGFKQAGGLSVSGDGKTVYVGVTMDDDSHSILSASTTGADGHYDVVISGLKKQPNGMAFDNIHQNLYCTDEGKGSDEGGTLWAVNVASGTQTLIKDQIPWADGCWLDADTGVLYVGELLSMKIMTFRVSETSGLPEYVGESEGLSGSGITHMLDDITVLKRGDSPETTTLLGCDWTGKEVKIFQVNGESVSTLETPGIDMYQPTSVRWGRGPGFDENSVYITEGGGATKHQKKRRVFQVKMGEH